MIVNYIFVGQFVMLYVICLNISVIIVNVRTVYEPKLTIIFYVIFYSLKPIDIAFMKALHHKVNIVPVIAKADTLTRAELVKLKRKVCLLFFFT